MPNALVCGGGRERTAAEFRDRERAVFIRVEGPEHLPERERRQADPKDANWPMHYGGNTPTEG
jgi:hypothetical protein